MDDRTIVERIIHYAPDLNLSYLSIPKTACSTFKRSIWEAVDKYRQEQTFTAGMSPHSKQCSPFVRGIPELKAHAEGFLSSSAFVVVRNPYSRLLSAYLDKVVRAQRDAQVWKVLANQLGYRPSDRPTFSDFVVRLSEQRPETLDVHVAPQHLLAGTSKVRIDHVGYFEDLYPTKSFLADFGVQVITHAPHKTDAEKLVSEYYTDREVSVVYNYYHSDFTAFGYSSNPAALAAEAPSDISLPSISQARAWIEQL